MVDKFVQPNYTTQTNTAYPLGIDNAIAVLASLAAQFQVYEKSTPNMTVEMAAGAILLPNRTYVTKAIQTSGTITAPASNPRNDLVVYDATTGNISIVTGAEAASPADPAVPANKVPVARIRLQASTTAITNSIIDSIVVFPPTLDALLNAANTFVADQTIQSSSAGATGAKLTIDHSSASPAASDEPGAVEVTGRNSAAATKTYSKVITKITDPVAGSEDSNQSVQTMVAGTLADRIIIGQGVYTPGGSDQGPNTMQGSAGVYDGPNRVYSVGNTVPEAGLASSSVSQAKLKTGLNTVSGTTAGPAGTILTGGRYCFLPTITLGSGSGTDAVEYLAGAFVNDSATSSFGLFEGGGGRGSEYTMINYDFQGNDTSTIRTNYINSSPPYDPFGMGDHMLFVYALIERTTGKPVLVWEAVDPPWMYNGRTDRINRLRKLNARPDPFKDPNSTPADRAAYLAELRMLRHNFAQGIPEVLLTQKLTLEQKNADMDLVPHPIGHNPATHQVVLLAGNIVEDLYCRSQFGGDMAADILLGGYLTIDNDNIRGAAKYLSSGLLVSARFK